MSKKPVTRSMEELDKVRQQALLDRQAAQKMKEEVESNRPFIMTLVEDLRHRRMMNHFARDFEITAKVRRA